MKKPHVPLFATAIFLPAASVSANTLLWMDNFNAPSTANFDTAPLTGRLTGTLAPTVAAKSARVLQKILDNQLQMQRPATGYGRIRFQNSAGWFDWSTGPSSALILEDRGIRVEFDFTPTNNTSTNWVAFSVGFKGSGEPSARVNNIDTDYGILFRNTGLTERFDNSVNLGAGGSIPADGAKRHIVIDYLFESFAEGTNVRVRATQNGVRCANDTFTWNDNADSLFMELETAETGQLIDNLSISTIPIVYSFTIANKTVNSGAPQGTDIGILSSETFNDGFVLGTYTLIAGEGDTDNAKFQITDDALQKGSYNFVADPAGTTYSIRVKGTGDEGGSQEQQITLTILKDDDFDELPDAWEIAFTGNLTDLNGSAFGPGPGAGTGDFDGDGLTDLDEYYHSINAYPTISPILADTDGDGLSDGEEVNPSGIRPPTNPTLVDTDKDGISDLAETNTGIYVSATDTGTNATMVDTDGDGARDKFEIERGSDPNDIDSRPALPAGFALVQLTDDASTGINTSKTYTHAVSGGGAATINGVDLLELSPGINPPNFSWTASTTQGVVLPVNLRSWVPENGGVTGTGLISMLSGFAYESGATTSSYQFYSLTGLVPGQKYELKIFIRPWEKAGVSRRPIDLTFINGTSEEKPFGAFLEDRPGIVLDNGNNDSAYYLSYTYEAQGSDLTILATIPSSAPTASGSFHLYGLTNEVVSTGLYQTWASQYPGFASTGLAQDPDHDGVENLLEYAFDTNPTVSSTGPVTYAAGVVTSHGQPALDSSTPGLYQAVFGRRKDYVAAGLTYTVQFSADLATWVADATTPVVLASDATTDVVSVPFPATIPVGEITASPRFFRVTVGKP